MIFFMLLAYAKNLPETCVRSGNIALTIDEGPTEHTMHILDVLEKENVKATFHFNTLARGPHVNEIYKRVVADGHDVGLRTHPGREYTNEDNPDDIGEDISNQIDYLEHKLNKRIKYARSPLNGSLPVESVHLYFTNRGIIQTAYSYCPYDTSGDPEDALKEFLAPTNPKLDSFIIQLYDQRLGDEENLSELIKIIRDKNYKIVKLSECLDGYKPGTRVRRRRDEFVESSAAPLFPSKSFLTFLLYFIL